ncbi:MAG: TM2 domain-containing protein [Bacteroidales bacterium]|nr:TM2 domain-containing protein [Bacteroidales bacterium]
MNHSFEKYCVSCGAVIDRNAEYCPKCGVKQSENYQDNRQNQNNNNPFGNNQRSNVLDINKEWIITLLLCIFLGELGVHRFYNGRIGTGLLMLITLGGLGIWYLIDIIFVVMGRFKDKTGKYIQSNI